MKPLQFFATVLTLVTLSASAAFAAEPAPDDADRRLDQLLRSIDIVPPDRAALETAFPEAWRMLDAVARDGARDTWSRVRAVSLLSYFAPEARTRSSLEALSGEADKLVRRQAIYTLGRAFGDSADAELVRFIEARAADRELEVAEHAVRSLRWVDHAEAKAALDRLSARGPDKLKALARTTSERRAQRMLEPRRGD